MPITIAYATTEVTAEKTAGEIEMMLQNHGCASVAKEFESGRIKSIFFQMNTAGGNLPFKLPVNVDAIYTLLIAEKTAMRKYRHYVPTDVMANVHRQAERTAWRIIWWWLKSQLALIQTDMVSTVEVFLPYMLMGEGQTFFQHVQSDGYRALMPSPNAE